MILRIKNHPLIEVFLETEVKDIFGYIGNYHAIVNIHQGVFEKELKFGNIVVATGLKPFNPSEIEQYGYGQLPNVLTSIEFEKMLKDGNILTKEGIEPKHVAIIHCVGSRNINYHEYCSRTCCMTALKYANQIRSQLPNSHIYDIYADMRVFGKDCEELYTLTSRRKIKFLMFDQQNELPKIKVSNSKESNMLIEVEEKISGLSIDVPADMVILMVATEANENAKQIAHAAGISLCGNSFYIERHPKLDPVATTTDGVYIAGSCQSPKDITDSVSQARAAAARILSTIAQGRVHIEVTTAHVNEETCCGCQVCINVCPYTAISYDPEKKVSNVNEALCKGCGTCGAACPTGTIRCRHFTDEQILSQIEGIMSMSLLLQEV
jgi:heterodisulfide reductase subunit A2